eukprot:177743_1
MNSTETGAWDRYQYKIYNALRDLEQYNVKISAPEFLFIGFQSSGKTSAVSQAAKLASGVMKLINNPDTKKPLYCVMKSTPNDNCKWQIQDKLCAPSEAMELSGHPLPRLDGYYIHSRLPHIEPIIKGCRWSAITVFKRKEKKQRLTLSIDQSAITDLYRGIYRVAGTLITTTDYAAAMVNVARNRSMSINLNFDNIFENVAGIKEIIETTSWDEVPVFNRVNPPSHDPKTLTMSKANFMDGLNYYVDRKDMNSTQLIPINTTSCLWIVHLFNAMDMGILFNVQNTNDITVTAMYLDADTIRNQVKT